MSNEKQKNANLLRSLSLWTTLCYMLKNVVFTILMHLNLRKYTPTLMQILL